MKKKDIITLAIAIVVLLICAGLIYRYLVPPAKNNGVMVEVPRPVMTTFEQSQLDSLHHDVTDFSQDLTPNSSSSSRPIVQ